MSEDLKERLNLPPLVTRILLSRGITTIEEVKKFLYPELKDLSDPYLLPDIERAVERVVKAITNREKICIYGDYDADGVTSVAICINFFKELGFPVEFYIPTRNEGYGLNVNALSELKQRGIRLLIAVDLGSSNFEEIDFAKNLGIDTIVIDHHEVKECYPSARAFVNPKRRDSLFPTKDLAACGVTFFFLIALRRELMKKGIINHKINLRKELDLVALGTIADMVPLSGDNRIITKFGLEMMKKKPRQWLKSFYKSKILPDRRLDEFQMSFIVIPRINAPGRISHAAKSVEFLIQEDAELSLLLLDELNEANRIRQTVEEDILQDVSTIINEKELHKNKSLVLYDEGWHIGVIGIVAQKVAEMYNKPTIILTLVDGILKGSGRGVDGFDLYGSLSSMSHLLIKYGGHRYACGLSLAPKNLECFSEAFENAVSSFSCEKAKIFFDTEAEFDELTGEAIRALDLFGPFGLGNPYPRLLLYPDAVFESNGRLKIRDKKGRTWYGFFQKSCNHIPENVHGVIVSPVLKEELGEEFVYLLIRDILGI
ncbi:MAG: single-stranded-DNA-specific exonuclease RecJ [Deltaproteobacteria bacterium]|nr:single-stranded-DNA-specific exonuclease RecJ [Deltaproteobacteria bacterium]